MSKSQEQYEAEYTDLEAKERSLEIRLADEEEERHSLYRAKKDTADIWKQIRQTESELRAVRRDMVVVSDEAGWGGEEDDDELFYTEQSEGKCSDSN